MIRLLALSPSGEAFFTRDQHGVIREHWRLGGLDPLQVSEREVDRAVVDHGFERAGVDLETWAEVEDEFDRRIRRADEPLVPTPATARALPPVLDRWLAWPADRPNVVPLVLRLLQEDSVRQSGDLARTLLERARRAESNGQPRPSGAQPRYQIVANYLEDPLGRAA